MYLNELSVSDLDPNLTIERLEQVLTELVDAIRAVRSIDARAPLITSVPIGNIAISPSFPMARLRNDGRFRDHLRYLLAVRNLSPYPAIPVLGPETANEYTVAGRECIGLALAYLDEQIALSLATSPWSDVAIVELGYIEISASGSEIHDEVEVRHVAKADHVGAHRAHLLTLMERDVPDSVKTLWDERAERFPNLRFLDRVEDDLARLESASFRSAYLRLRELDTSSAEWKDTGNQPTWGSKVTSESETRRSLCYFPDGEGLHLFEMHARYTPTAGRVHFRFDETTHQIVVGYVGIKLGV